MATTPTNVPSDNRSQGAHVTHIVRRQFSPSDLLQYFYSSSVSVGPVVQKPMGASLIALSWTAFTTSVVIKFQTGLSASGPFAYVRKSDDSGDLTVFGAGSSTAARAVFLPDLAPFTFLRPITNKKLITRVKFQWQFQG